jgi:vancomycin resistance protein YoaR
VREATSRDGPDAVHTYERKGPAAKLRRPRGSRPSFARRRRNTLIALIAIGLLVVVGVWYAGKSDEIRNGVRVGEVNVGGMTREEARKAVERHAADAFQEIRFGDGVYSVPGEKLGVKVEAAPAVDRAYSVGREGWVGKRASDIVRSYLLGGVQVNPSVEYDKQAARTAVEDAAREYYRKPQNATFSVTDDGKVEVKKGMYGRVLNQEKTLANLHLALADMSGEVPIAADYKKPEVSTRDIEGLKPTQVIGKYQTDFRWDSNPSRKSNMRLAASAVNNTVLAPGQIFSFDKLAEPLHYNKARTFSQGGIGFANGGGLCQVSSTLYMAAQYAGLQIVERHPHYAVLPYIKPGFDATVWFGAPGSGWGKEDMKFRNNTGAYIVVREWVDQNGFLNAQILGQPTGKKVEMRTVKIWERPQVGIKWATYKKVTDVKTGKVLFNGHIHSYIYAYNPPVPPAMQGDDTSAPRVAGWPDPTNTTGWASPH